MGAKLKGIAAAVFKALVAPFVWFWQLGHALFQGRLSPGLSLLLELMLVLLVAGGLAWLNLSFHLERYLTGPYALRRVWLGVLALCVYGTIRLSILLFRRLRGTGSDFHDIREAMSAGWNAAMEARINLQDSPLFLVIGADDVTEQSLRTSEMVGERLTVDDGRLPAHWFGDAEAIWLSVPGISAVSQQTARERKFETADGRAASTTDAIRLTAAELELAWLRMTCLVRHLRRLRGAVVPVNGIILLLPVSWMQDPSLAPLAEAIRLDMEVLQTQLGVKCTCLLVLHGIEQVDEFQAFIDSTPATDRQRRCGCTLPALSEFSPADGPRLHGWICRFMRQQVYREYIDDCRRASNPQLFRLLQGLQESGDGLTRLLHHAFPEDLEETLYPGGVYFAELSPGRRTFVDGVAARLLADHDNTVGWNHRQVVHERRLKHLASLAAGLVVAMLTVDAFLIGRAFLAW